MATATYGTRDGTRFSPGGTLNDTQYYTLVDSTSGEITIKEPIQIGLFLQPSASTDRTVGSIPSTGTNKGKFVPNSTYTLPNEKEYFSNPENIKAVKNQAIITANKAQAAEGVTAQTAQNRSQQLINQGTTTIPTATGTDPENPQANFEDTTAGGNALKDLGQSIADRSDTRKTYGDYSYPKPFPEKQDRVKFSMFRYSPKDLKVENFKTGDVFGSRSQPKDIFGTVQLPITPQIQDTNTVSWGNDDINAFAAMAASASYNLIKNPSSAGAEISAVARLLQSESGNASLKSAAAAHLAGEAAGGNKNFLTRVTGALINPNTELLFNAPTLRTFGFSFTMSAREPSEAQEIKKIIRFFKQGMSVKRASTGLFLKTPNIFDIKYILGDTNNDHPWINKIKTCALTNCTVNYTPAGNYATFYDGAMSAYELTLSFTELDPVFEDDYSDSTRGGDDNKDTFIGY
jgi:hypothetical protein